jgi:hypothetical protein
MMTKIIGKLFDDGRDGILIIKPSKPFFGCSKHENRYPINNGTVDIELLPTPAGIHYLVSFKAPGDFSRTDFTLRWRVPDQTEVDITPASSAQPGGANPRTSPSIFERVQLKRVAGELTDTLNQKDDLNQKLLQAEARVQQLQNELQSFRRSTDSVLANRDKTIAQLQEQNTPTVNTVYLDKPVPPAALYERINRLEQENIRLLELNAEYYKSVVDLYQLQLDKARNSPQALPVGSVSSPQKRLLRKLLGK